MPYLQVGLERVGLANGIHGLSGGKGASTATKRKQKRIHIRIFAYIYFFFILILIERNSSSHHSQTTQQQLLLPITLSLTRQIRINLLPVAICAPITD